MIVRKKKQYEFGLRLHAIPKIVGPTIMLDEDLAEMYNVETKRLNEQVKRNLDRFPKDFMFTLTEKDYENFKSHFAN